MSLIERDVAIVGAGPAALFAVFELGMLGYSAAVIDSLPQAGGQLAELYPDKPIYDIPGFPKIMAGDLAQQLIAQAAPFNPHYIFNEQVTHVAENSGKFELSAGEHKVQAKVILIAAGGGMFTPRKPTQLDNLEAFEASGHVHYAVKNPQMFAGKTIVIAGGGDSAVDWAVALADVAAHVHVVHRRPDFRAADVMVAKMKSRSARGEITLHTGVQLHRLTAENTGELAGVTVIDASGTEAEIKANELLCFYGLKPELGPVAEWGLELNEYKINVNPSSMETARSGILAIGDIVQYPGKLNLILTGFAEAAIAAKTTQSIIDPDKKFKLVYSTSKGVPNS